jgi:hypothetical protein
MDGFLSLVFVAPVAAVYKNLSHYVFPKKVADLIELHPEGGLTSGASLCHAVRRYTGRTLGRHRRAPVVL